MRATLIQVAAAGIGLEVAFWTIAQIASQPIALAALVAMTALAYAFTIAARKSERIVVDTNAIMAFLNREASPAKAIMKDLALRGDIPCPAVKIASDDCRTTGGAGTQHGMSKALVTVSRTLADGDQRLLRAVLAHELGHVATPTSWLTRIGPSGWMLGATVVYALLATAIPGLLWLPKIAVLGSAVLTSTIVTVATDERRADRYAVGLTNDPVALLEYLSTDADRVTSLVHRQRRNALRAMVAADQG